MWRESNIWLYNLFMDCTIYFARITCDEMYSIKSKPKRGLNTATSLMNRIVKLINFVLMYIKFCGFSFTRTIFSRITRWSRNIPRGLFAFSFSRTVFGVRRSGVVAQHRTNDDASRLGICDNTLFGDWYTSSVCIHSPGTALVVLAITANVVGMVTGYSCRVLFVWCSIFGVSVGMVLGFSVQ